MTQREFEAVLDGTRQRVERLVALHMDLQLRVRFSPADVARSMIVEAAHRRDELIADGRPIIVWLRELVLARLNDLRRLHLPSSAKLPVSILPISDYWQQLLPYCEAGLVAENCVGYRHHFLKRRIRLAVKSLVPSDQELLALAHCEQLDLLEIAAVLQISPRSVKTRRRCAIARLRKAFQLTRRGTELSIPKNNDPVRAVTQG